VRELTIWQILHFIFMGFLGSVLYVLIWAKDYKDLKSFNSFKTLCVGLITGYIYSFLYGNYNFPDLLMASVAGYFGVDFVEAIMERLRKLWGL